MDIVISHESAWHFWHRFRGDIRRLPRVSVAEPMLKPIPLTGARLAELATCGFEPSAEQPLDLLFYQGATRSQAAGIRGHSTTRQLPPGSLIRLSDNVLVASPELVFAQCADRQNTPALIMMGCELCGCYWRQEGNGVGAPQLGQRSPCTSTAAIRQMLDHMGYSRYAHARRAIPHVLDCAESPMEAKLALLLSLPARLGGWALPKPTLNHALALGPAARRLYPHSPCRLDLFWAAPRLDVEYDGVESHPEGHHAKDVARAAALKVEGVEVLTLTKAQVYDPKAFAVAAGIVAARLGRKAPQGVDFPKQQRQLRIALGME